MVNIWRLRVASQPALQLAHAHVYAAAPTHRRPLSSQRNRLQRPPFKKRRSGLETRRSGLETRRHLRPSLHCSLNPSLPLTTYPYPTRNRARITSAWPVPSTCVTFKLGQVAQSLTLSHSLTSTHAHICPSSTPSTVWSSVLPPCAQRNSKKRIVSVRVPNKYHHIHIQ